MAAKCSILRWFFVSIAVVAAGIVGGMCWYASYASDPIVRPLNEKLKDEPLMPKAAAGMKLRPFSFAGYDGRQVEACIAVQEGDLSSRQQRVNGSMVMQGLQPGNGYVLVCTDWDHGIVASLPWAEVLTAAGYTCVLWNPRGADQAREYCTHGLRECDDVPLLLNALDKVCGGLDKPAMILGEGFGASLALQAAPKDARIRSVVAIDAYKTLKDAVWADLEGRMNRMLCFPAFWLTNMGISAAADYTSFDVAPVDAAPSISRDVPVLLVCTERYFYAPLKDSLYIYSQLSSDEKAVWCAKTSQDAADAAERRIKMSFEKGKNGQMKEETVEVALYSGEDQLNEKLVKWVGEHVSFVPPKMLPTVDLPKVTAGFSELKTTEGRP